jgi:hypothetical protein
VNVFCPSGTGGPELSTASLRPDWRSEPDWRLRAIFGAQIRATTLAFTVCFSVACGERFLSSSLSVVGRDGREAPARVGTLAPPKLTALVEEAVDGMPQAFPIDWLGEMRREARRFGSRDITVCAETAEGNSTHLAGIA